MSIGQRIKKLRKQLNLTQTELADKVDLTYVQIGRYETRGSIPSADVLQRLAEALQTTTDFLMTGGANDLAKENITDKHLLRQFQQVEQLPTNKKKLVIEFLDAFLLKDKIQNQLSS